MGESSSKKDSADALRFRHLRKVSRELAAQFLFAVESIAIAENKLRKAAAEGEPPPPAEWVFDDEVAGAGRLLAIDGYYKDAEETGEEPDPNYGQDVADAWKFAEMLIRGVVAHHAELDEFISRAATNWSLVRIAQMDRAILRTGAFEILHPPKGVSPATAINEAVETAKRFGQGESSGFINGVLDKIRRLAAARAQESPDT